MFDNDHEKKIAFQFLHMQMICLYDNHIVVMVNTNIFLPKDFKVIPL